MAEYYDMDRFAVQFAEDMQKWALRFQELNDNLRQAGKGSTSSGFPKIAGCLADAISYAKGDTSKGKVAKPTEEFEPVTIKQDRGPTLKFTGLLIAKTEFDMRSGGAMRYEIWETAGNALIAVSETNRETRAVVVEPGDEFDMRCAVMDFFDWENRARSMVRDQLKWKLVREVA